MPGWRPSRSVDMAEAARPGARGDVIAYQVDELLLALHVLRHLEVDDLDAPMPAGMLPALHAAAVLVVGGQDLVAGREIEAGGDAAQEAAAFHGPYFRQVEG